MIRILFAVIVLFFAGCSSQPAPAWQQDGNTTMTNFINSYMEGNDKFAENYYLKLEESLKLTADPDIMVIAPLTKCAMNIALLEDYGCEEAQPFVAALKKKDNIKYFNFVSGKVSDLPLRYKDFVKSSSACLTETINLKIKKLPEPLSKIIASSVVVRNKCYDEKTLINAVDTASAEGWKKAALKYLDLLLKFYEEKGYTEKAGSIQKRIELAQ